MDDLGVPKRRAKAIFGKIGFGLAISPWVLWLAGAICLATGTPGFG